MRRTPFHPSLLLAALLAPAAAIAAGNVLDHNRYRWNDAQGNLHYSDVLPPEAVALGYDVVSPNGILIKHVERAKTREEIAAAKLAQAKAQAAKEETDARARVEQQLLAGYPTEDDLKRSQQDKMTLLDQQIATTQISLRSQEQVLSNLLNLAAEVENNHKDLPDAQAKQLATQRKLVDDQRTLLESRQKEREDALAQFDRDLAHYRDVKARAAEKPEQQ